MLRRIAYVLGGLGAIFALLSLGSWLWLRSDSGSAFVRERIQRAVAERVNGMLSVGPVSGSPLTGIAVDDVRFERDGDAILKAERLRFSYRLWDLLMGTHALGIAAKGLEVTIREREDGTLNVSGLLKPEARAP